MTTLEQQGFDILTEMYSADEVERILITIQQASDNSTAFRKTADLFAIRQVLKEIPDLTALVLNGKLRTWINTNFGTGYFIVKSIYFDKPGNSNWFVAYHQDLTISVDKKIALEGFGPWTVKQEQFAVQPPADFLKNMFTIRIHLDDTDEQNGALKVIPGSHLTICRPEAIDRSTVLETICVVPKGGVMIMKPLLLHASGRTQNGKNRRVLHIEFCNKELPAPIQWVERQTI